jgi:hypothetical protein
VNDVSKAAADKVVELITKGAKFGSSWVIIISSLLVQPEAGQLLTPPRCQTVLLSSNLPLTTSVEYQSSLIMLVSYGEFAIDYADSTLFTYIAYRDKR